MKSVLKHTIQAEHDAERIMVYQAFNTVIGNAATVQRTLDVPAFSKARMTWIKPSFLWMMYRAGWGHKDPNQRVILKIAMSRKGFVEILRNACLSSFDSTQYESRETWQAELKRNPNRVQWDPDKDLHLKPTALRAIQIGIAAKFVPAYLTAIEDVQDITSDAHQIEALVQEGNVEEARKRLPHLENVQANWLN